MTWTCIWTVAGDTTATVHPNEADAVDYAFRTVSEEWGADLPALDEVTHWLTYDKRTALDRVLGERSGDTVTIVKATAPTGPEPLDAARRLQATRDRDLDVEPIQAGHPNSGQCSMYIGDVAWQRTLDPVRLHARTPEAFDRLAEAARITADRIREKGLYPEHDSIVRSGKLGT